MPARTQDALVSESPYTSCSFLPSDHVGLTPNTMPGPPGSLAQAAPLRILLRVQFDDELLVDRRRLHVIALRHSHDLRLELFALLFEPWHSVLALPDVQCFNPHLARDRCCLTGYSL